jgi:1-acyl-sn-glycerol-3-phosphate acyltransferase
MEEPKKFIDIEKIIQGKNPSLHRLLPRFVLNYIKRKIHEDLVNDCIWKNRDKTGYDFNEACLEYLGVKIIVEGQENVPPSGGVIMVANHPLGGIDGMAMIHAASRIRKDVRFVVNDILTNMKNFDPVFVGVNKVGLSSSDALRNVEALYASDKMCFVFPAGLVSRKQDGKIRDLEWKKSFVTKAIMYKKPILPVYIEGHNSKFFYNFALWRKRLGIKANIEMFFLPDEMVKFKGKTIRIRYGKLLYPEDLDKPRPRTHFQWAQEIKDDVYKMGEKPWDLKTAKQIL